MVNVSERIFRGRKRNRKRFLSNLLVNKMKINLDALHLRREYRISSMVGLTNVVTKEWEPEEDKELVHERFNRRHTGCCISHCSIFRLSTRPRNIMLF